MTRLIPCTVATCQKTQQKWVTHWTRDGDVTHPPKFRGGEHLRSNALMTQNEGQKLSKSVKNREKIQKDKKVKMKGRSRPPPC